ncbi:MAG TPA: GNAT family N-acetyltransferase [Baekduia sp.]|nr:GNAT family N-acetyltransferase [Baekduia sp.]
MDPDVRLEPFTAAHLDAFTALTEDPDVRRFTRFPDPPDPGFPAAWLARYQRGRADGTREAFAILDGAGGAFLGLALAPHIDRDAAEAELGYVVAPAARGRGVATAAVLRLTRWAFDEQRLERLTLIVDIANVGSQKVAERCGYVRDGMMRNAYVKPGVRADTIIYSRLPTDPEPSSAASGAPHAARSSGGGTL